MEKNAEFNNELGQHLLQIRKEKGLTLNEVEGVTGVSASYLFRIESGKRIPSYAILAKLEEAYDFAPGGLLDTALALSNIRMEELKTPIPIPARNQTYTYSDYLNWEGQWELIEGVPSRMASPGLLHQRLVSKIGIALGSYLNALGPGCETLVGPIAVCLSAADKESVVKPDIAVVCQQERFEKSGLKGAPDLVVEVISLSTAKTDRDAKFKLYRENGVKEYWIADPENGTVEVYNFEGEQVEHLIQSKGVLRSAFLKNFELLMHHIFE